MRVLVVEDNALLRHHLKVQLQELGHQVDAAEDAREADYYLGEHLPDIAIVDLGLPDEDGLSLIRRWRSHDVSLPVLVLTAREGWQDKVEVLSAGADDYVTKPFHIEEVAARMQALLRRNSGLASQVISSSRSALPRLACRYRAARIYALMVEAVSNSSSAPISTVWPCKSSTKTLIFP